MVKVAVDVMGGDFGPRVTVPAALEFLAENPEVQLLLVGDQVSIQGNLPDSASSLASRFDIRHSDQQVAMDDKPSFVLRNKRDSSMALALEAVTQRAADACVSAGNTGALMILGRSFIGMHEGIDRPAFITEIPTLTGHCHVLDLGANLDCDAQHLYQFAVMGSIVAQAVDAACRPSVALLNVGQEAIKGNDQVKEAAALLANQERVNYVGFVEGDHIFSDAVDVIVCDGFVGNVALKTSEGLAKMISTLLEQSFRRNLYGKLVGLLAQPIFKKLVKQIDPKRHNGASLLGLRGIVVKSHGNADIPSFKQAIRRAVLEVEKNVPQLIHENIAELKL